METISYGGWNTCFRLTNGVIELIVTGDVGPRIIRFGMVGGKNVFKEFPEMMGRTGGDEWRVYGGHRLWHAPESHPRTYFPDNQPVTAEPIPGGMRVTQPPEPTTGIQKTMEIFPDETSARVTVVHHLKNTGLWTVKLAPWALSVMDAGGTAIVPLPPRRPHSPQNLLPVARLNLWGYTNLADPRWLWGENYVLLRQDARQPDAQKIGVRAPDGWAAYANHGMLFISRVTFNETAEYPDGGSNIELFTDAAMLEVETLGGLVQLAPGKTVSHTETWFLFSDVPAPATEADVRRDILPHVAATAN